MLSLVPYGITMGTAADAADAAEDTGADLLLKKVAARVSAAGIPPAPKERWGMGWSAPAAGVSPVKTGKAWLSLFDARLRPMPSHGPIRPTEPLFVRDILMALPPPEEWEGLKKEILARPEATGQAALREIGLRLLADVLTGDQKALQKNLEKAAELQGRAGSLNYGVYALTSFAQEVYRARLRESEDASEIVEILQRALDLAALGVKHQYSGSFEIPDLVSMVGEEKADAFLRKALLTPGLEVRVERGDKTAALARKVAIELLPSLPTPPWGLVDSISSVELYEALQAKTGEAAEADPSVPEFLRRPASPHASPSSSYYQKRARAYYVGGLITQGRTKEAVAQALKPDDDGEMTLSSSILDALKDGGHTKAVLGFLREALSRKPELPFWSEYITVATEAGETEEMLKVLREAIGKGGSGAGPSKLQRRLIEALLAADQVDEGIREMQRHLSAPPLEQASLKGDEAREELEERGTMAVQLVRLGILLDRKPLIDQGIQTAREIIALLGRPSEEGRHSNGLDVARPLAELYVELGRPQEAEALLGDVLADGILKQGRVDDASSLRPLLSSLLAFYHSSGRPADVLTLVDKAPFWGSEDLAECYEETVGDFGPRNVSAPLGYIVASALAAEGRPEEARTILYALLNKRGDFDAAYELLLKLDGQKALPRLDELFARDQFEERPLIWKARLLHEAGKQEEAEATVRKAIAIDPSDGEEGAGDRMRAYAVLADIREARGDKEEAGFYREVVKAIRLSEQADGVKQAGLLSRAIKMYREALTHFSDAYCIQSRLAQDLLKAGKTEEATAHYRRAFELMPDSFGRVESHCFGCERAFQGEQQQAVAETVFKEFAIKSPDKPQVHYLLGYLREEQGRYGEALESFRLAVKLDPDYLNAWKHMRSMASHVHLPGAVQDAATWAILRLDPLNRHGSFYGLDAVSDLRALWKAVDAVSKHQQPEPAALYPFAASKALLEETSRSSGGGRGTGYSFRSRSNRPMTPAKAIGEHRLVSSLESLLQ